MTGDASAVGIMTSGGQEPDSRFSTAPSDPPPYPAPPDDPNGPDTAALSTRRSAGPDTIPGQAAGHSASLASSARIPIPGSPYAAEQPPVSTESTVPSSGGRPDPLAAPTTQLPTSGATEIPGFSYSAEPETQGSADSHGSSADTGSLPSWLSSIGEEPAPHPLETGGRRRKIDLTESAESADAFNPFEDQHLPDPVESAAVGLSDPYELPAIPSPQHESDTSAGDPTAPPELPSRGLPTRASRTRNAPGTDEEPAPAPITARRLPRSAARHAPAPSEEAHNGSGNAHEARTDTGSGPESAEAPQSPADELPAPRRLPRSAARYNTDDDHPVARADEPAALRIADPVPDTAPADDAGAHTVAPPRLAPPGDGTPILDRLLDPEPAHGIDTDDESGAAPVARILTRILESEQEPAPARHSGSDGSDAPEAAAETPEIAPLTLVPDETSDSTSETRDDDPDARPPLETRRSRRAREAAEASGSALPDQTEPELSDPVPDPAPEPIAARRPAPVDDTASRHSRSEEGADIDIHLIMRLLTASDDLEVLAGQAETGEVSAAEVARAAREARAAVLSAVTAWYGGPAQMVKFANALLQAARES
ncbi:hypothetical protein [Nocardia sp. NPDC003963]